MSRTPDPPGTAFRRRDAVRAGVKKHRLDGPSFQSVFPSIRVAAALHVTVLVRAEAALLLCHYSAVISHHTAARIWGGIVPDGCDVHVSVPEARHRPKRRGIRPHVRSRKVGVVTHGRVRLTDPPTTFVELARELDLVDLVVLGDSLVKAGRFTVGEVQAAAKAWHGPGAVRARHAATLVRAAVDSPMETRLRLLLVFAGLPEPQVNFSIRNDDGQVVYRLDLAFAEWCVAVEYDGRQHAEDERQWGHDLGRRESLDGLGWRLVVCRATDVYTSPRETVDRVVSALRGQGMELSDPTPSPLFDRHFPGRPGRRAR
ncbi:MAG: DUF559 domain-containing protein [Ornithinimicrobium sp.]|uniref:DUF559 domain-containing protein n=1 Tax=Ornithinimicrobium sp. TaxID=1977084 RepID=UPI003D9AF11E